MKIVLPSQNKHLTDEEFKKCCELVDYYVNEGSKIIAYSQKRHRDPALYDRGNVWQGNFVNYIVSMVLSKKYNNINRLRLIGWHFSAYRIFDLAGVGEPPASQFFADFYSKGMDELPEDVDRPILEAVNAEAKLYTLFPRLLPLFTRMERRYLHGQPMRFGEVAGEVEGLMVNGDSVRYWGTVAALHRLRLLEHIEKKIAERGICRVMEIGPGYGGLGYQLKKIYGPKLQFIGVDLVESLLFSSIYLTTLINEPYLLYRNQDLDDKYGIVFVPTFRSPEFFDATPEVDLCINTVSMNEMSAAQVDYYGKRIAQVLAPDGAFFECNWKAAIAGPNRIDVKSYLALHFNERLSVEGTEVGGDGNLDLWSKALPSSVYDAARREYGEDPEAIARFTRA